MDQVVFLLVSAAIGYIAYKWGYDEGVIQTSEALTEVEEGEAPDAK